MSKNKQHINRILSLESLIKYAKGNLLGDKKKEVEMDLNNSPLMQDAAEGIKEFSKPEKLSGTVDDLNKMISAKMGVQPHSSSSTSSSAGTKVVAINVKMLATIGAAATVIVALGLGLYYAVDSAKRQNTDQLAVTKAEEPEASEAAEKPMTFREYVAADSAQADTSATDTVQLAVADEINLGILEDDLDFEFSPANGSASFSSTIRPNATYNWEKKPDVLEKKEEVSKESFKNGYAAEEREEINNKGLYNSNTQLEETGNTRLSKESKKSENQLSTGATGYDLKTETDDEESSASSRKDKYLKYRDTSSAAYDRGVKLVAENKLDEATTVFETISDDKESPYYEDAIWQLANIHIKQDDKRKAKRLLKKIDNSTKYGEMAKKLLETL